jgi:hypothetical protein
LITLIPKFGDLSKIENWRHVSPYQEAFTKS